MRDTEVIIHVKGHIEMYKESCKLLLYVVCVPTVLCPFVTLFRFYCRINNAKLRGQQRLIQDGIKNKVMYEGTTLDPTSKPKGAQSGTS